MSDDLSHDPHLRAALRHAPDHALVPPAGVSQAILSAARQVHRPARPAPLPPPPVRITIARPRALEWMHRWFASPRIAGGLATGLVAALGLGLWMDLSREPVVERAVIEPSPATRVRDAAPATPPAAPPSGVATSEARDAVSTPTAPATQADTARTQRATRPAQAKIELERRAELARQAPAEPTPAAPQREDNAAAREAATALTKSAPPPAAAPPAQSPAPAPAPAPSVAAAPEALDATAVHKRAPQAMADAQRDAATRTDSRMSSAAGRAAATAGASASAVEGAVMAEAAAASPAFTLLRRARSELAAGSARWSWMPPGSPMVTAFDEAGLGWLARVVQASRGRWSDVSERAGSGEAIEVRWWRDDWPQATLRIETDGLRWVEHNGRVRHAPLDAATLQRLRNP